MPTNKALENSIMPQFDTIKRMVRDHLKDAEQRFTGTAGDNVGPSPESAYANAFGTATGAYAGKGITAKQWSDLHTEIREHQLAFCA